MYQTIHYDLLPLNNSGVCSEKFTWDHINILASALEKSNDEGLHIDIPEINLQLQGGEEIFNVLHLAFKPRERREILVPRPELEDVGIFRDPFGEAPGIRFSLTRRKGVVAEPKRLPLFELIFYHSFPVRGLMEQTWKGGFVVGSCEGRSCPVRRSLGYDVSPQTRVSMARHAEVLRDIVFAITRIPPEIREHLNNKTLLTSCIFVVGSVYQRLANRRTNN